VASPAPVLVELLGKPDCHLCEEAKRLLQSLQHTYQFTLRDINIAEHALLDTQYREEIPVVFINGRKAFKYRIDVKQFARWLWRAQQNEYAPWRAWLGKKGPYL
jgi:glutaredoxin